MLIALLYGLLVAPAQAAIVQGDFRDLTLTVSKARVVDVVDGVTLSLDNGKKLRLSGIWVPWETGDDQGAAVAAATAHLKKIVGGRFVRLYQTKKQDIGRENRMGHMLAHVERDDGLWLQGELLNEGLAHVMTTETTPEQAERMYTFERAARAEKKGLWSDPRWNVLTPDEAKNYNGEFRIIEGKVYSIAMRNNVFYVNFSKDWKDDFTLTIPSSRRMAFARAGYNIQSLTNKNIRVRGWMRQHNGPLIEITHPQQIEILDDQPANERPAIDRPEQ